MWMWVVCLDISNSSPRLWRVDGEVTPGSWTVTAAAALLIWNSNSRMTIIVRNVRGSTNTIVMLTAGSRWGPGQQGYSRDLQTDLQCSSATEQIMYNNLISKCTTYESLSMNNELTFIPLIDWDRFRRFISTTHALWLLLNYLSSMSDVWRSQEYPWWTMRRISFCGT